MSVNGGRTSGKHGFFSLIRADYVAGFAFKAESPAELRLKYLPRLLTNASLHAVLLVRLMQVSPRVLAWISRSAEDKPYMGGCSFRATRPERGTWH